MKRTDVGPRLSDLGARRHVDLVAKTVHSVLDSQGEIPPEVRWAIAHNRVDEIPAALKSYIEKVRQHAYKVTDDDIAALTQAGYSEDAIFEVTASAAVGAAILRLERGLIALNESVA